MLGVEVAAGYALAYLGRKVRRAASHADAEIDRTVDAAMSRVHNMVSGALGDDPAMRLAEAEALAGQPVSTRTRNRVVLALEEAVEGDRELSTALEREIAVLKAAEARTGTVVVGDDAITVAGTVTFNTAGGPAALRMGDVTVNPRAPGAL